MRPPRLLSCLALLLIAGAARAQPVFDALTRADGLPSDYVLGLYQDRHGYLWLGTDAGLARYDGQHVETFTTDEGLPHSMVYNIVEDGAGTLYAGTFEGLARYDGHRFHPVAFAWGRSAISSMQRDPQGRVVINGGQGVGRLDATGWRFRPTDAAAPQTVLPLPDGRLLFGQRGGALVVLEADARAGFNVLPLGRDFGIEGSIRAVRGPNDTFYLYGDGFVRHARLQGRRLVVLDSLGVPMHWPIRTAQAFGQDLYFSVGGSGTNGVYRLRFGQGTPVMARVLDAYAESITSDYEGQLWFGTFGSGAFRLRALHLRTLTTARVVRLAQGIDGSIWATGQGLWRVLPGASVATQHYEDTDTRTIGLAPGGRLVVSTNANAFLVAPAFMARSFDYKSRVVARDGSWIAGLDVDGDTVWAATYGNGVKRFVGGRVLDSLRTGHGLPTDVIEDLVRTPSGLWFVTRTHGALRWRGTRAEAFGVEEGLPSSAVFGVYEQADGTVWFGTDRGIGRLRRGARDADALGTALLRGQRVAAFFERPGVPGIVYAVGDRGLYRVMPSGQVYAHSTFALLPEAKGTVNAARYDAATDRLFLGTTRGLVVADLRALPTQTLPPPRIAVQSVHVDDRLVDTRDGPATVRLPELAPGLHRVEIAFAPLALAGAVRAEVRLAGGAWRDVGTDRRVVLPGLGPGDYRVELRAVRADGGTSARPAVVVFRVRPFLWQRPVFWVVAALALIALTVLAVWFALQRRLRARVRTLEAERREQAVRERLSRDLHDHIGGQLATLVSAADLAGLAAAHGDTDRALAVAATLADEARQALGQLRQTVSALRHDAVAVTDLFRQVRAQAEAQLRFSERPALDAHLEGVPAEGPEPVVDATVALQVLRVAQEAVTNVLRHAQASELRLTLHVQDGRLRLRVEDDGIGLQARREDTGDGAAGPGFGLGNMHARAADVGGTLEVVNGDAAGTRVRLEVPLHGGD